MRVGRFDKLVSLYRGPQTSGDSNGWGEALSPATAWVAIEPQGPTADGRGIEHVIRLRYRSDVTMDAVLVYGGTRQFFVRGFRNISEQNAEMELLCEEVIP